MKKNDHGLFITGTDTDVGKTIITAVLGALLQEEGFDIGFFKPLHTGVTAKKCPDLEIYKRFAKLSDPENDIVPIRLREPQAPSVAAHLEKRAIQIEKLFRTFYILRHNHENLLIEGIGGVEVPIDKELQILHIIKRFKLPALVVARPSLGTINHTCLTVKALKLAKIPVAGIVFNNVPTRPEKAFALVQAEIARLTKCSVLGVVPHIEKARAARYWIAKARQTLNLKKLTDFFTR
jgi:dethiobiotin synthetase